MKILSVGHHCCIRMQKQAWALINKGHEVHILGNRLPNSLDSFTTVSHYATAKQLKLQIKKYIPFFDIVHIHNEPSWMAICAKEVTKKPVIMDVHDSMMYRTDDPSEYSNEERISFEIVDAFVFVGKACQKAFKTTKPSCVIESRVNEFLYQYQPWQYTGGVVYEGRADTPDDKSVMQYANYIDLCKEMKKEGVPFNIFTPKFQAKKVQKYYKDICILQEALPYSSLLKTMGTFDWGFCGNIHSYKEWDIAVPNKMFEYMAAGIPIVAMNCKQVEKFIKKHDVGIVVNSVKELKKRWNERSRCQKNVFLKRYQFSMENHIHKLEELYQKCILRKKKKKG